jgi:predicted alpha/beta hydrolase
MATTSRLSKIHPPSFIARTLEIAAADGVPLASTLFAPVNRPPVACALVGSAMGVRRGRYEAFSRFLAANGIVVCTFDYRGVGDSGRGHVRHSPATLTEWAEQDIESLVHWLGRRYPGLPLLGIGHSIGGQLFGLVPSVDRFSALFLVGSQRGYPAYWRGPARAIIAGFWRALPAIVRVFGYLPMRVAGCEPIPRNVALEWRCWGRHPDFRDRNGRSLSDRWALFRGGLLSISFEDDFFAARDAVAALVRTYAGARAQHRHFSPSDFGRDAVGHSGFFTPGVCPGLWVQALQWMRENAARSTSSGTRPPAHRRRKYAGARVLHTVTRGNTGRVSAGRILQFARGRRNRSHGTVVRGPDLTTS